jgi:ribose transport system ATP-binding protein
MPSTNQLALEFKNISKDFPGVKALDNVSLAFESGEVVAMMGENGAGKSTLVKILSGALQRDKGEIILNGLPLPEQFGPMDARKHGIAIIYQELSLLSQLSVAENIYLTHEPLKVKFPQVIDYKKMFAEAEKQLQKLKLGTIDVKDKVEQLPISEKQMVEIAKALAIDCRIIIMDEPTTSLTWEETKKLFEVIRSLKKHGVTVIYISHRMDEIFEIADRAIIMRDGKVVGELLVKDTNQGEMISLMTGKKFQHRERVKENNMLAQSERKVVLQVKNLTDNKFIKNASFSLYENEILGIGGLIGSRRTELARMIFGADKLFGGQIYMSGERITVKSPADSIKIGIGYLSENRKEDGLNLGLTIQENIIQTDMKAISHSTIINWHNVLERCEHYVDKLRIKGKPTSKVVNLSGGNQQKVAIAKWLHAGCKILIFDEPTRGIDVGAKAEIYQMIKDFAREGRSAIVISSEVNELVDVCDRVHIMSKGDITSELTATEITQDNILQYITMGARKNSNE